MKLGKASRITGLEGLGRLSLRVSGKKNPKIGHFQESLSTVDSAKISHRNILSDFVPLMQVYDLLLTQLKAKEQRNSGTHRWFLWHQDNWEEGWKAALEEKGRV